MSESNNQLKEALVEALEELFSSDDIEHATFLVDIMREIRADLNLIMMTDKYAELYVWKKLREQVSTIQTLMSTTATFVQSIDDIDGLIGKYVRAFIPFNNATEIVDEETISKAAEHVELEKVLKSNYWLFFLMFASTNMRIVNAYLNSIAPPPGKREKS
jgi:hypothetical protein